MIPAPTFILIGCGARKLPHPAPARDLYTGSLFRAARSYAEASGLPWMILSGLHGLVAPDQVLEPYDHRLTGPWTSWPVLATVEQQLRALGWSGVVEVHAGHDYGSLLSLAAWLADRPLDIISPVAGLPVGRRLAWYRAERERRAA